MDNEVNLDPAHCAVPQLCCQRCPGSSSFLREVVSFLIIIETEPRYC